MTDTDLIAKKLALIETYVRELQTLCRPAEIPSDLREARFAEHTLQIAIQARSTWRPTSSPTTASASRTPTASSST